MPRQRSKKLSTTLKVADELASGLAGEEGQSDGDHDDLEMLEKDEDEEELDRLVLGDDAGFKAKLGQDMEWDDKSEPESGEGSGREDLEADTGLEGVDDADVRRTSNIDD